MSNVQIEIKVEEQEFSLYLSDVTGNYTGNNTGGYGTPNYRTTQIAESYIEVQGPSDKEAYPHKIDVTGVLPNADCTPYEILPSQIGQGDAIESGTYKFKLTHIFNKTTGGTDTKVGYYTMVAVNNISCCIDSKAPKASVLDPKDPRRMKYNELNNLLEAALYACSKGFYDEANKTIEYLKSQCICNGCK